MRGADSPDGFTDAAAGFYVNSLRSRYAPRSATGVIGMSQTRAAYHRKKIRLVLGSGVKGPTPEEVEAKRKPNDPLSPSDRNSSPWRIFTGWGRRFFGKRK